VSGSKYGYRTGPIANRPSVRGVSNQVKVRRPPTVPPAESTVARSSAATTSAQGMVIRGRGRSARLPRPVTWTEYSSASPARTAGALASAVTPSVPTAPSHPAGRPAAGGVNAVSRTGLLRTVYWRSGLK
jgi:hypothetical protein